MECPKCGGKLQVTHTYPAGQNAQARDHRCRECGLPHTSVTFLVEGERRRGRGAKAMAKKARSGAVRMEEL